MNSRLTEQAAAQHTAELLTAAHRPARRDGQPTSPLRAATRPIRRRTGWALISVGLWLASEGR
jgi:predicted acetyltransferase